MTAEGPQTLSEVLNELWHGLGKMMMSGMSVLDRHEGDTAGMGVGKIQPWCCQRVPGRGCY